MGRTQLLSYHTGWNPGCGQPSLRIIAGSIAGSRSGAAVQVLNITVLVVALLAAVQKSGDAQLADSKPDILYIVADDLG